jgi:hypothetical protein
MNRMKSLLLLSAALLAVRVPAASATVTYAVGACQPSLPSFLTISEALAASPSPDVVEVCADTYAEQLMITNPVTIEGISAGGSSQVVITQPLSALEACGTGLAATGGTPLVCVASAGTVNISNITVYGPGAVSGSFPVGIEYNNSSGTLNHVETRFQESGGQGEGIQIDGAANTVTVENSTIRNFDGGGITTEDFSPSGNELTVNIEGNVIVADANASSGIADLRGGASVTISGNVVDGPAGQSLSFCGVAPSPTCGGIISNLPAAGSISNNRVIDVGSGYAGIGLYPCDTCNNTSTTLSVTSNKIFDISGDGIQFFTAIPPSTSVPGTTVQDNDITQAGNGIDFECSPGNSVGSNTISAIHSVGLANVPSGVTSTNTYFNVPTLSSAGCP